MPDFSRRAIIRDAAVFGVACLIGGCVSSPPRGVRAHYYGPEVEALYSPISGELHPVPAVDLARIHPAFFRAEVDYATDEKPGTIIVDPRAHYLYFVEPGGRARRYGVAVGGEAFAWSGTAKVQMKREWPDWHPPKEMLERRPELLPQMSQLPTGIGMRGGPDNPLGARALYLWQGKVDTLYRIHGTNEPWKIGTSTSSGCIRMINQDVIDLYARTRIGAKVVVLATQNLIAERFDTLPPGSDMSPYLFSMRE